MQLHLTTGFSKKLLLGLLLLLMLLFVSVGRAQARDCDDNAVIRCGALTVTELQSKLSGDVPAIFAHYGITASDFSGMVDGTVRQDGTVWVNGQSVATGAISVGRQDIPDSTHIPAINVYERPTSVSFRSPSLSAFVKMTNGQFEFAILKDCGNPVRATPTPTPPPPPVDQPTPPPPRQVRVVKVVKTVVKEKPAPKPKTIPDTGAGNVLGVFASVTTGGFLSHRIINRLARRR